MGPAQASWLGPTREHLPRGGNDGPSQGAATLRRTDSPFWSDIASQRMALRCDVVGALPEPKFIGFHIYPVALCAIFATDLVFSMFRAIPHENWGAVTKNVCIRSYLCSLLLVLTTAQENIF